MLTHVCHVDPEASWNLRVTDFAVLIKGIDEWVAAQPKAEG